MKIYVYVIYFPTSKRPNPHYIGIAKNLEKRMSQHFSSKYLVGKALDKYDDWIIKKLHTCRTYEEAYKIEIEEIRNFNCVAPNGYNLTRGGEGTSGANWKLSEETIEKMKSNKNAQGCKHTEEAIEKLSKSLQGNQNSKGYGAPKGNKNGKGYGAPKGNQNALKNGKHTKEAKIKRIQTRIVKLEKEN